MKTVAESALDVRFLFSKRPDPLPGEMRPHWRIAVLLILLSVSRGKRASLRKLHVLNWAVRNPEARKRFMRYIEGSVSPTDVLIRVEPGLNHALDLAKAEELVNVDSGKTVVLAIKGEMLVREIMSSETILADEKQFASEIRPHILEKKIDALLNWEDVA